MEITQTDSFHDWRQNVEKKHGGLPTDVAATFENALGNGEFAEAAGVISDWLKNTGKVTVRLAIGGSGGTSRSC